MYSKTLLTLAVALIGAASSTVAFAGISGEATPDYPSAYTSQATRTAVREAAIAARAAGQIVVGDQDVVSASWADIGLTRAQVRAEAVEANRLGLIARGEHSIVPTTEQLARIQMAGLKALSMTVASR